jgi:hypothetical protein
MVRSSATYLRLHYSMQSTMQSIRREKSNKCVRWGSETIGSRGMGLRMGEIRKIDRTEGLLDRLAPVMVDTP